MAGGENAPSRGLADNTPKQSIPNTREQTFRVKQSNATASKESSGPKKSAPPGFPTSTPIDAKLPNRFVLSDRTVRNRRGDSRFLLQHSDTVTVPDNDRALILEQRSRGPVAEFLAARIERMRESGFEAAAISSSGQRSELRREYCDFSMDFFRKASDGVGQARNAEYRVFQRADEDADRGFRGDRDQVLADRNRVLRPETEILYPELENWQRDLCGRDSLDLRAEISILGGRVLELEERGGAGRGFDEGFVNDFGRLVGRSEKVEGRGLKKEEVDGIGESVVRGVKEEQGLDATNAGFGGQKDVQRVLEGRRCECSRRRAGFQEFGNTGYEGRITKEYTLSAARPSIPSPDLPIPHPHPRDLELEYRKNKDAVPQDRFFWTRSSRPPMEPPAYSHATTSYSGATRLCPVLGEDTGRVSKPEEPSFESLFRRPFAQTLGTPIDPPCFSRRLYGGGFPSSDGQDVGGENGPRRVFAQGLDWRGGGGALASASASASDGGIHSHVPNLGVPPWQSSHSRQPTVTDVADEDFVEAGGEFSASKADAGSRGGIPGDDGSGGENGSGLENRPGFKDGLGRGMVLNWHGTPIGNSGHGSVHEQPPSLHFNDSESRKRHHRAEPGFFDPFLGRWVLGTADGGGCAGPSVPAEEAFASGALQAGRREGAGTAEGNSAMNRGESVRRRAFGAVVGDDMGKAMQFF